jgi:phosphate/sulfate permease
MERPSKMECEMTWRVVYEITPAWLVALPLSAIVAYIVYSILSI